LSLANQLLLIDRKNNYPEGTQYSDQYLNQSGAKGFEGLSVFYGAKAQVTSAQMYDANGNLLSGSTQPATIVGDRVLRPATSYTILASAYKINGVDWPSSSLTITNAEEQIPEKIAESIEDIAPGVHAQAYNQVEFDTSALQFGKTLKINSVDITLAADQTSLQGLIDRINFFKSDTKVEAKLGERGQLVLENTASQGGRDIVLSSNPIGQANILGVVDQTYTGMVRVTRDLDDPKSSSLKIELGQNGSDSMLLPTGLRVGHSRTADVAAAPRGAGGRACAVAGAGQADRGRQLGAQQGGVAQTRTHRPRGGYGPDHGRLDQRRPGARCHGCRVQRGAAGHQEDGP